MTSWRRKDDELAAAQLSPEPLLRERRVVAHELGATLKLEPTMTDETLLMT